MRDTISGHNSVSVGRESHNILKEKFAYTLLPVWVLTYRAKGNDIFFFAMNGQTGEIVGKLPLDIKKLLGLGAIIFAITLVILLIGGLLI